LAKKKCDVRFRAQPKTKSRGGDGVARWPWRQAVLDTQGQQLLEEHLDHSSSNLWQLVSREAVELLAKDREFRRRNALLVFQIMTVFGVEALHRDRGRSIPS
jgi:hypothetical protein